MLGKYPPPLPRPRPPLNRGPPRSERRFGISGADMVLLKLEGKVKDLTNDDYGV